MDVNFVVIFLSLLIGTVIGIEFGKHLAIKRVSAFLKGLGEQLRETAKKQEEEKKKKAEELKTYLDTFLKDIVVPDQNEEFKGVETNEFTKGRAEDRRTHCEEKQQDT